jgi:hypothetical protein
LGFSVIFKKEYIKKFTYGIWNIHTGKLPDNRGRHPIAWSFLNNDIVFYCTIHAVDERIDQGIKLSERKIFRDIIDDGLTIERKIDNIITSEFIEEALVNFEDGKIEKISKGKYYTSLTGKFQNIDPKYYDSIFIFNLFKSQIKYGGVVINGKKYTHCTYYFDQFKEYFIDKYIVECKDKKFLALS